MLITFQSPATPEVAMLPAPCRSQTSIGVCSVKLDDFDPVRPLAYRILPNRTQRTRLAVDAVSAQVRRQLTRRQQVLTRRVDIETTRLFFGLVRTDARQLTGGRVDLVRRERARCAL